MLKKLFYISILLIFITVVIFPKQITFDQANTIAENWTQILEEKFDDQVRIKDGHTIIRSDITVAYVFEFYPKGYMIVSAEDYFSPVKFYSLKYDYRSSTKPLDELIFDRYNKVINLIEKGDITPNKEIVEQNRAIFKRLINRSFKYSTYKGFNDKTEDVTEEVKPLLTSEWGQYSPYNDNCPVVDGVRAPAGCVAIAFAQIFNYWEWPDRGVGTFSYNDPDSKRIIYANFDKEYQWWYMEDKRQYSEENKKAVAELCYDVGVASISGYNSFGTGSTFRWTENFVTHLKYSPDMKVVHPWNNQNEWISVEEWFNIAKNQIDNRQPCAYSISTTGGDGHAVIIDGYRITDGINLVHINFGWSSAADGYYQMDKIVTKAYDFTGFDSQDMVINIYPYPGYKKPTGIAPDEITGYAKLNKSAFLTEYVCELTWSESPSEDKRIREYIIYRQKDGGIEEFARVEPKDGHSYTFRVNDYSSYVYSVGVIDKNGVISDIPGFINLLLEN